MIKDFLNTVAKAKEYSKIGYQHTKKKYQIKQKRKILLNITAYPFFSIKWFKELESGELSEIFKYRKRLYIKPYRPYININWSKDQSIKVIKDTYRFLKETEIKETFLRNEKITIATIVLKDNSKANLTLDYDDRFRKEGEFTLSLFYEDKRVISLAFSIEELANGDLVARVGCIQGTAPSQEYITKSIQKQMHSLRAKSFIVLSALKLFDAWGLKGAYFIANQSMAHLKKHFIHLPKIHDITLDYDKTWQEMGGVLDGKDWYKISLKEKRKPIEEIKSKKRAEYKRRYHLLDELYMQIDDFSNLPSLIR